jgi:hypothetical protein
VHLLERKLHTELLIFTGEKIYKYFGNTVSTCIFKMVQNMPKPVLKYRSGKCTRGSRAKETIQELQQ